MGFFADRAKGHGPGRKPLDDLRRGFDLVQGNRLGQDNQFEEPADVGAPLALIIDHGRKLFEGLRIVAACSVLKSIDRFGIPIVMLTLYAVMDLPPEVELMDSGGPIGHRVAAKCLFADHADSDPLQARGRAGKVPVYKVMVQSDRLEDLSAAIRLHCRDPHLRKDLQQTLIDGLDELGARGRGIDSLRQIAVAFHIQEGLKHEIGIDRSRAIADKARELVHIARLPGFKNQSDFRSRALADEMVVNG